MDFFNDSLWNLIAILAVIVGFGFLIFVHELGHFLVAKWVGIRCTQFAIGFGQSMMTYRPGLGFRVGSTEAEYQKRLKEGASEREIGETEYRLNWIPLGGYVKMLGQEDIGPDTESSDPRAYNNKPVWARACVISAGVIMNLVFGLLFFIIAFMAGVQFPSAVVGQVDPSMPAAVTYAQGHEGEPTYRGLRPGDRITHINGGEVRDFMDVQMATMLGHPETPIRYTVDRPGYDAPLHYEMRPRPGFENLLSVGMAASATLRVEQLRDDGLEHAAGVQPGMRVAKVDGEAVQTHEQYLRALSRGRGEAMAVTFVGGEGREITVEQQAQPSLVAAGPNPHGVSAHLAGLSRPTMIPFVAEDSPAEGAGVRAGDILVRLGEQAYPSRSQVFRVVQAAGRTGELDVAVLRDGEVIELGSISPRRGRIGIGMDAPQQPFVGRSLPETPAYAADVPAGSRVVAVAGEAVDTWADMQRAFQAIDEAGAVELAYIAPGDDEPTVATLELDAASLALLAEARWTHPPTVGFHVLRQRVAGANPIAATVIGVEKTHQFMVRIYQTVLRLVQGTVRVEHLRGPVGIVHEGTRIFDGGFTYFLFFLGLISVNLAVINFLPIPIVDGGHMVFLIIEKLKGSPASPQIQGAATMVGLALILLLFISVTYHDIARLLPW